jgi:SAM-dependent methyltransferase
MRSDAEWKAWGKKDPMFAVATWAGRDKAGGIPWTPEAFLALGKSDIEDVMRHWDHYGRARTGTCIEIGCGSGRMTNALLDHFDRVFAIDVSPEQIATAKQLLGDRSTKVEFSLVEGPEVRAREGSCIGMFTSHVLQHLSDKNAVRDYLAATYPALAPGATICFHLPVPGAHGTKDEPAWRLRFRHLRYQWMRWRGRRDLMEYNVKSVATVFGILSGIGYSDAELRIFRLTSNGDPHSFFFARRPH